MSRIFKLVEKWLKPTRRLVWSFRGAKSTSGDAAESAAENAANGSFVLEMAMDRCLKIPLIILRG